MNNNLLSPNRENSSMMDGKSGKSNTTDSLYRGIIVACLRSKQLIKGATPRTTPEFSHKRKNTRIAVEEVKQGLIYFETLPEELN